MQKTENTSVLDKDTKITNINTEELTPERELATMELINKTVMEKINNKEKITDIVIVYGALHDFKNRITNFCKLNKQYTLGTIELKIMKVTGNEIILVKSLLSNDKYVSIKKI